jgi:serine/threonine protein phosphatase PrpC/DNA-binding transcriptional MerR regulator
VDGVKLLTIGEFARLARLSQKALRLYDELGLLRPSRVDEWSGYRYYAPSQLERARLVAWLRRLGMPLAQIGPVLDAPPAEAAALVAAFLRVTEADFAERQRLAQFLISYLREGATAMPDPSTPPVSSSPASSASGAAGTPLAIRYAAASDTGLIRERNQDVGYAGPRLVAVADGFGPAGEQASAATIDAFRRLESEPAPDAGTAPDAASAGPAGMVPAGMVPAGMVPADLLNVLSDALTAASDSVRSISASDPDLEGSGSTLTAMLLSGSRLALVHIGDTRAYLFRDGGLFQVTHDHSVTQSMIDAGRLTQEEAMSHPQRSLLLRAVGASAAEMARAGVAEEHARMAGTPDLSLLDAQVGDRYLITSDGLTRVVPDSAIRQALSAADRSPAEVIQRLITLANEAGGPDNIALALADIVPALAGIVPAA